MGPHESRGLLRGLLKGEEAHKYLVSLVAKAADANLLTFSSGGIAGATQNIFAVDGNTAGSAGIAEMLVQSQGGEIEFLPALPAAWANGSVRGICARGGYVIDVTWSGGRLELATVLSRKGGTAQLRYGERTVKMKFAPGERWSLSAESFARAEKIAAALPRIGHERDERDRI